MRCKLPFLLILTFLAIFSSLVLADPDIQEDDSTSVASGAKLAFVSSTGEKTAVFTMNDDGTDLTELTNNDTNVFSPLWSPDASKIIYITQTGNFFNSKNEIWVVNHDGTGQLKLADDCEKDYSTSRYAVSWSPDGAKVLFSAKRDGKKRIFTINPDGSDEKCLTEGDSQGTCPSWAPDGSKVLCLLKHEGDQEIYLMNPDGSEPVRLTKNSGDSKIPTWSPDGKKIAFIYNKPFLAIFGRKSGIYVMNADGSDLTWLTKGDNIFWAPDNSAIAFNQHKTYSRGGTTTYNSTTGTYSTRGGSTSTTYSTYVINIAKKSKAQLLANYGSAQSYPAWSPDATKIAYISGFSLYIRITGQSKPVKIEIPYAMGTPVWSPDGTNIACVGHSSLIGKPNIYIGDVDGTDVYKMSGDNRFSDPIWAPIINHN